MNNKNIKKYNDTKENCINDIKNDNDNDDDDGDDENNKNILLTEKTEEKTFRFSRTVQFGGILVLLIIFLIIFFIIYNYFLK